MLVVTLLASIGVCWCVPIIPLEMLDLTHSFDETSLRYPLQKKFEMNVTVNGTQEEGYWLQLEDFSQGSHVGTHMDAPCHFSKEGWTIPQIPMSRLIAPAAVVDITDRAESDPDTEVTVDDLQSWERISGLSLNDTIILVRTGWSAKWPDRSTFFGSDTDDVETFHFPGMSEKASRWLVANRSAFGVATEALSIDAGQNLKTLMAHRVLLGANMLGLENVANVDRLPLFGATLYLLPMKVTGACGAPVRILATFPKVKFRGDREQTLREIIVFNK